MISSPQYIANCLATHFSEIQFDKNSDNYLRMRFKNYKLKLIHMARTFEENIILKNYLRDLKTLVQTQPINFDSHDESQSYNPSISLAEIGMCQKCMCNWCILL